MTGLYRFVVRLRWFWISIILLYSLMPLGMSDTTPQQNTIQLSGLIEGLIRCLALLLVLMYFILLVYPIPLTQLQQSWYWLMRPVKIIGINPQLISMRIALTFHAVHQLQAISERPEQKLSIPQLPQRLFEFLQVAIEKAATQTLTSNQDENLIPCPGYHQWLVPIGLLMALSILVLFEPIQVLHYFNW